MSGSLRLPLAASIAGHGCMVALLILLAGRLPPVALPVPIATGAIAIILAPPEPPVVEAPKPPPEPPPIPETEPPPAEPPPPVVDARPPPPRPQPKPAVKSPPRSLSRPAPAPAPLQTAVVPLPAPSPLPTPTGPIVSPGYRAALSAWLESHKQYPDSARARGEQGRAMLLFHVDRSGRVLNYTVAQSTGYPDLDVAVDQMMRGASLPPFPGDMTASDVEVSVTIHFALAR